MKLSPKPREWLSQSRRARPTAVVNAPSCEASILIVQSSVNQHRFMFIHIAIGVGFWLGCLESTVGG